MSGIQNIKSRGIPRKNVFAWFVVLGLILFPFIFSLFSSGTVTSGPPKFWQGQMIVVFIMAVYAMSYNLLLGYVGVLSFGHAAFFGGGAYGMALFLEHVVPVITKNMEQVTFTSELLLLLAGFLVAIILCILLGLLFSVVSVRVKGVYFAMITLAIAVALYILAKSTDFVQWTGADEGLHGIPIPKWINPTKFRLQFYYIALGLMFLMYFFIKRIVDSPTGKIFIAIRENDARAEMIGFNPAAYRTLAFILSAVAAGLAGALYAIWDRGATPSLLDLTTTINVLIMTILGGIGTLLGPALGAALMEIFGHFFYQWFGARWPLVFGIIFIVLVLFLPLGIVGTWKARAFQRKQTLKRLYGMLSGKKSTQGGTE